MGNSITTLLGQFVGDLDTYSTLTTGLVFTTALLVSYMVLNRRTNQYSVVPSWPPGPKPWPMIGNIPDLKPREGQLMSEKFQELADNHGNIVHVYLGMGLDLVFITGTDLIREAYINHGDVFSNRPPQINPSIKGESGIIMRNGEEWKNIRRFTMKTLRDFGVGKKSLESAVQEEARQVVEVLLRDESQAVDPKFTINQGVSNVICKFIFGQRYDHDDEEFLKILKVLDVIMETSGTQSVIKLYLPTWIMKLCSNQVHQSITANDDKMAFIQKKIDEHREDFDPENLRDFTDYFIKSEMDEGEFSEKDMLYLISNLFMTGTETVTTTLRWMIVYLLRQPEMQEKCRREIHDVIGEDRMVCMKDVGSLPYTEAMILELQRCANLVPIGIFHSTARPVEFKGYLIPEKTFIMTNYTQAMFNEKDYPNPKEFKPERWLNEDHTAVITDLPKSYMPFGVGPRICAGDNLAKTELFIFIVHLVQQLKFEPETAGEPPSDRGVERATNTPQPHKVRITSCLK